MFNNEKQFLNQENKGLLKINGKINPSIIEEITKTQSLFENLKILWKIKFKINTATTIINWPISIPIANSMIEINTFSSELTTPKKVLV